MIRRNPVAREQPALPDLLERHRDQVERLVRREAGVVLMRFEEVEDLVQGAFCSALRDKQKFEWRSEPEFVSWLFVLVRRHMSDRRDYWLALKRNRGRVLRLTWSGLRDDSSGRFAHLAASDTGPGTFAERRDQLRLITTALAVLPPRDRDLIQWTADGLPTGEQARRLGLTEDATHRARSRAFERLRKVFLLVSRDGAAKHADPLSERTDVRSSA